MNPPPTKARVLARSAHPSLEAVATTDALWWRQGEWRELAWWEIERAFWSAPDERLTIIPVADPSSPIHLLIDSDSRLPEVVRERVMASIIASVPLEVGSGVVATFRATPSGPVIQKRWQDPSEAATFGPALQAAVREAAGVLGIDL